MSETYEGLAYVRPVDRGIILLPNGRWDDAKRELESWLPQGYWKLRIVAEPVDEQVAKRADDSIGK